MLKNHVLLLYFAISLVNFVLSNHILFLLIAKKYIHLFIMKFEDQFNLKILDTKDNIQIVLLIILNSFHSLFLIIHQL